MIHSSHITPRIFKDLIRNCPKMFYKVSKLFCILTSKMWILLLLYHHQYLKLVLGTTKYQWRWLIVVLLSISKMTNGHPLRCLFLILVLLCTSVYSNFCRCLFLLRFWFSCWVEKHSIHWMGVLYQICLWICSASLACIFLTEFDIF